ncbi:hypothetical protein B4U79_18611 [Dinothrombium tinctorium]|uniref:SKP1 component dimerisation domain-containing protein n=1 Tax=Dinothrombium tinctorium TaxID=1965070 RepID=A0A3S3PH36_9ACAR|nr:hypothetical protein B4U79_18611 [Dinothrombium tinctorium]
MRHHTDDTVIGTEGDEDRSQYVSIETDPWDANFLNCCKKIYSMSKGKSSEEIKHMLKEICGLTDEDLQRIADKYEWMARVD